MAEYEYEVQGYYGHGWETVTTEVSRIDADTMLEDYNENEPHTPHRVRPVKVTEH